MASKPTTTEWNRQDRDLLIELKTKLDGVIGEIQNMRDNTISRLAIVEQGKLDRTEANRLQSESLTIHTDHETRLRASEKFQSSASTWGAASLVALGVLEFLLSYFHPFIHN